MFKKILLAVDGSEPSQKASEKALSLAEAYGAEVILLTVINPPPTHSVEFSGIFTTPVIEPEMIKLFEERGKELLAAVEKNYLNKNIPHRLVLKMGTPAEEIIQIARQENVDAIIMGSRGLTGMDRFLLGSTSERVVRHAHCSVIIVR